MGDPLVTLDAQIDWEAFRCDLARVHEKARKSKAGAKPIDVVLMFKMLVLQQLYNLADEGIEYQVRERLSFMRFLGLQLEDRVPDAKTVWLFRKRLKRLQLVDDLCQRFQAPLAVHGDMARAGQMVAARLVEAPLQRHSREENIQIKAGTPPADWPGKKQRPKNCGALDEEESADPRRRQASRYRDSGALMNESLLLSVENLSRSLSVGAAEASVIEPHKNQIPIIPVALHSPSTTRLRNGDIEPGTAADRCTA